MENKIEATVKWQTKEIKPEAGRHSYAFNTEEEEKIWYKVYGDSVEALEIMRNDMTAPGNKISFVYGMNQATEFSLIQKGEPKKKFAGYQKEDPKSKMAGFAVSYTKDLIVAGKITMDSLEIEAERIHNLLTKLSK